MKVTVENITPKMAEAWLNINTSNRQMKEGVAERYAIDMRNGDWTECPEPISFYDDGVLADGQHRLWAIIDSGVVLHSLVVRDLPRSAGLNINTGASRSVVDAVRIAGYDTNINLGLIAIARGYLNGESTSKAMSNAQKLDAVALAGEPAQWANKHLHRKRYLCGSAVGAALARAYAHFAGTDQEPRLLEFCTVFGTGVMEQPGDKAAVILRNYLINMGTAASISANWRDTFLKAQNAIAYFVRSEPLSVLRGVQDEAFPLNSSYSKAKRMRQTTKNKKHRTNGVRA